MKLSKKLLACLLAALMVFSAAGCAGSSQAQTTAAPGDHSCTGNHGR